MPAGRPRKHDRAALVRAICRGIAGGALVKVVCARHGITAGQLRDWVADHPELSALYARARESQAHAMAEDAIALADAATVEDWQAVRLRVDARKWLTSKIAPRLYGEKITQEISGPDGGPVQVEQQVWTFGDKTVSF